MDSPIYASNTQLQAIPSWDVRSQPLFPALPFYSFVYNGIEQRN